LIPIEITKENVEKPRMVSNQRVVYSPALVVLNKISNQLSIESLGDTDRQEAERT
jgi:hypothetical protein